MPSILPSMGVKAMPLDRFIINFNSEPIDQYSQYSQKPPIEHGQAIFGDIGDIEHRVENENQGAEVPFSLNPLPNRYWLDPIDNGFMPSVKTMQDLSECRGYPKACQRCRSLMTSGDCLLGPGGDDEQ